MRLDDLFQPIAVLDRHQWEGRRRFNKITSDSRTVQEGDIFVACQGVRMDGHDFLGQAIHAKPAALVFEKEPEISIPRHISAVRVHNSRASLALLLNHFYDYPDKKVKLIGVTGTNGKTTITYLLYRLLRDKVPAGYLGTLWYELPSGQSGSPNTTPGPETLIPLLHQMAQEGVRYGVLEVSSHGLTQERIHGLNFELGVFTQLTQDHLDYHGNMEHYFQTKRSFFSASPEPREKLINKDCPYGRRLIEEWPSSKTFSLQQKSDYQAQDLKSTFQGTRFHMQYRGKDVPFHLRLPMPYNVSNALAVLGSLDLLGFDLEDFRGAFEEIPTIPGRMERIGAGHDFLVFIDYAHTPDAFEQVLHDAKALNPKRILTLFGCGGDRDRMKRPLMAKIASHYSDVVIMTSDNPRSEDPEEILKDMGEGIPHPIPSKLQVLEVLDRGKAIQKMIGLAQPGDVVLILGKGHEDYQILGDKKIPFSDRQVVEESLRKRSRVFLS